MNTSLRFNEKNLNPATHKFNFTPIDAQRSNLYNEQTLDQIVSLLRTNPSADLSSLRNPIPKIGLNIGDTTIATVGSQYEFINHSTLITAAEAAFNASGVQMVPFKQSHDKSLQVHDFHWIMPEKQKIAGEDYYVGFGIKDSYGGKISCEGHIYLYRKTCSNGMHVGRTNNQMFKIRHTFSKMNESEIFFNIEGILSSVSKKFDRIERLPAQKIVIDSVLTQGLDKLYGGRLVKDALEIYTDQYAPMLGRNAYALMNSFTYLSSHGINSYTGVQKAETMTEDLFLNVGIENIETILN